MRLCSNIMHMMSTSCGNILLARDNSTILVHREVALVISCRVISQECVICLTFDRCVSHLVHFFLSLNSESHTLFTLTFTPWLGLGTKRCLVTFRHLEPYTRELRWEKVLKRRGHVPLFFSKPSFFLMCCWHQIQMSLRPQSEGDLQSTYIVLYIHILYR